MPRRSLALLCTAPLLLSQACASPGPEPRTPATGGEIAEEAGLGLGAALASIVYAPFKIAYATGGLVAGSLAWIFTGADGEVARSVMEPALAGDYVITPDRLRSPETIEFVGRVQQDAVSADEKRQRVAARARTAQAELPAVSAPPRSSVQTTSSVPTTSVAATADLSKRLSSGACDGTVELPPIQFDVGQNGLSRDVHKQLDAIPSALERCKDGSVKVVGHTDTTGSERGNLSLSRARAVVIRDLLVAKGVESARVQIVAAGDNRPASTNGTPAGRALNRRAEVSVVLR